LAFCCLSRVKVGASGLPGTCSRAKAKTCVSAPHVRVLELLQLVFCFGFDMHEPPVEAANRRPALHAEVPVNSETSVEFFIL